MVGMLFAAFAGMLFGAVLASFGAVLGERGLVGAANGRSRCVCGRQLSAGQNVPVLGWCRARGRAGCCGARIPVRYLGSELVGAAVGAAAAAAWAGGAVPGWWAVPVGVAVAVAVPALWCRRAGWLWTRARRRQ